jgi:acetyl/propionyl-CoA carboxylase alpha subunit
MTKPISKLLIANRGEVAIRIARAAEELGIRTLSLFSEDDQAALHRTKSDAARALTGSGARAYLDSEQVLRIAREEGVDAIHPGYGFLSESAAFAQRCSDAGITFVGPSPRQLALLGDKLSARRLAEGLDIPLARGSALLESVDDARAFFTALGGAPALLKAAFGGGGRGMRVITRADELPSAFARCKSEAEAAFANGALYMEELIVRARHIEVQVVGDGSGAVTQLGERDCSLQRRHQKLVEVAPSPGLTAELRARLCAAAVKLAADVSYLSLGTFEFLLAQDGERFVFMEANPRLQVEHTVTEEVLGIDLVKAQLRIAAGATLSELGLTQAELPAPRGYAIQLRVNTERVDEQGGFAPASGTLTSYELPLGPGVRIDGAAYRGYTPSAGFDALLLKLIVHTPEPRFESAVIKARRALSELRLEGIATNLDFLTGLLGDPAFPQYPVYTTYLEEHAARFAKFRPARKLAFAAADDARQEGARNIPGVSLAVPPGQVDVPPPLQGRLVSVDVALDARIERGQQLCILEAMKMESAVYAPFAGSVRALHVAPGENIAEGQSLFWLERDDAASDAEAEALEHGDTSERADVQELRARQGRLLDAQRPEAVAKRHKLGQRTARENIADLCDPDSFFEYGGLALAAQRSTRSIENLIAQSPADGVVTGIGTVNAALFGKEAARCLIAAYDYTVFAGTQGHSNHKKQDRMFELAAREELPVVLFAEGGGGRPGDTDSPVRPTLDVETFHTFASLSGLVPLVGVVSGRCFAGNAVLLGCCDVIIATENSNIGMGGPVMVEGAGIGSFPPEAIGPIDVQSANGVVDVRVADERVGTQVAKQYLGYFQGKLSSFVAPDAERLARLVPENRRRVYEVREVIAALCDVGSVLELRREFGRGMVTALARIEGRSVGILANEPKRLAGAIDAEGSDKAARFMRLCDAYGIPLVSLCDTPGFMVGPEAEKTAAVRRTCRMLVTAASLEVPLFLVVLRKAYGLGAMAMAGGHMHAPFFTVAWPSGEFGAMGLEGAVQLAFKKQLNAIADPVQREALLRKMADGLREQGKAINVASQLEIDNVIDPTETRSLLARGLRSLPTTRRERGPRRPFIDTW